MSINADLPESYHDAQLCTIDHLENRSIRPREIPKREFFVDQRQSSTAAMDVGRCSRHRVSTDCRGVPNAGR